MTKLNLLYILYIYSRQGGKGVNIFIDNKSGAPIYDQIYSQIKAQIIGGDMQEDESLPSIRSLAKDLRLQRSVPMRNWRRKDLSIQLQAKAVLWHRRMWNYCVRRT